MSIIPVNYGKRTIKTTLVNIDDPASLFVGTEADVKLTITSLFNTARATMSTFIEPSEPVMVVQHYGYDGAFEVLIQASRLETDVEQARRIAAEERQYEANVKRAEAQQAKDKKKDKKKALGSEAEERALYEQLKAKFEQS